MKDYWKDLSLREAWSKRERFNFIINHINEKLGESSNTGSNTEAPVDDEPPVTTSDISISVKDNKGKGIGSASVTVSQNGSEVTYTGVTGSAGGCTVRNVPLGNYVISTDAEGYISSVDDFTVTAGENVFEVVLEDEIDDDI